MATITQALGRVKEDLAKLLSPESIEQVCREVGHTWRDRQLDPVKLIHLFVLQILQRNTACSHLPRIAGREFTASAYFGQPGGQKKGCGFPVAHFLAAHFLAAFEADSGFILDAHVSPLRTHDMSQVGEIHPHLRAGDLLVADRGFCSYPHLAMLRALEIDACLRVHQKHKVSFRRHRRSTGEVSRAERKGRPTSRWVASLGLDVLHCKSVEGVMKELWMFVLVYNLVRMVMLEAARRQEVEVERISFIDALRWLAHAPADAELPALVVNPHRPDRIEPRVIKRRMKEFPLMKKPRDELRQALVRKKPAA